MDIEKDNLIIANEEKKMRISTVLFDLDGTLTDSGPGIINMRWRRWENRHLT